MRNKNWLLLVLAIMLSAVLVACSDGGDTTEEDPGTDNEETEGTETDNEGTEGEEAAGEEKILRIAETAEIPSMDPILAEDSSSIQYQDTVYEGLYRLGEDGELVSGIAIKEETLVEEEGLKWTFTLRDDAVWSNGEPVTANDFVYAWQRAIDPENGSFYAPYLMNGVIKNAQEIAPQEEGVEATMKPEDLGVSAPDDHTLVVELEKPTPYFESFAAFPTFLPLNQEFVEAQGDQFALEVENMLFNGPFVMTEWAHEESWELVKNDQYWDKDNVSLDGISISVVKENSTAVSMYETDKIDRVGLNATNIDQFATSPELISIPENVTFWLKMNQDSANYSEYMQNENFRRAIAQAVNKQAFIDTVYGNSSKPANYLVPEGFVSHPDSSEDFRAANGDFLEFDLEAAQGYWEAAKEEIGFDEVTISFISGDTDTGMLITEFFQNELETNLPGLTLELKNVPFNERLEIQKRGEFELVFSGWGPDYADAISFIDMFVTDGPNNEMGYSNPEYDKLVKQVKGELALDPAARFEAMQEAERILLEEDAALAPIFQRERALLSKPYVVGMDELNPFGPDYSYKYVDIQK
ncbi:peptide ABC transporter substrate-binding protein [Aquibacillus koreensis]|uniref:Peptide ABC transporter substrate-binding protein n=1 Tax=Aquibacillus koreensis TaxID=279446 RepID=A0A9X3WKP3_9BACI|nr:peptide ABC transporter substrate-binding protein [Aquibacillus koreensis]MCT2535649.1 peptide ABC transporter substrate-binding protein [Aquibacillus koreensis]MDC3420066.1 peptide ABC transporter substrate-binding protein [Aquibacillus koreensis]